MTLFNFEESVRRGESRLRGHRTGQRVRSDRGRSRLPVEVSTELDRLLQGQERPRVNTILRALDDFCRARGRKTPARATIYKHMQRAPTRSYSVNELPTTVRSALHNLTEDSAVPGHQLAFYCLNYGDLKAVCFAAGLPWLTLCQAASLPGWRPRSQGLLEAILRTRGIR